MTVYLQRNTALRTPKLTLSIRTNSKLYLIFLSVVNGVAQGDEREVIYAKERNSNLLFSFPLEKKN